MKDNDLIACRIAKCFLVVANPRTSVSCDEYRGVYDGRIRRAFRIVEMKRTNWLSWLLALSTLCLAEGQYMFRRPYPPPPMPLAPPQIYKKSWAPGPRIPPMGNAMPFGGGSPYKRPVYKPSNYRFRRPPGPLPPPPPPPPLPMFNALPGSYKGPPLHPGLAMLGKFGPPEYRPEMIPSLHRGGIDDDKGPIHTIPAPNLGPASKPYQQQQQLLASSSRVEERRPAPSQQDTGLQADFAGVFGAQEPSSAPQRIVPSNPTPASSVHQYEVTESNEVSAPPQPYFTQDSDSTQYVSSITQEQQDAGSSIQANLQSSMHVMQAGGGNGVSGNEQQDAARIYEVLNAFPQQLSEHYALKGQPQIQQHLLQQQLSQILQQQQQEERAGAKGSFSQPALHSFNYDEQSNKNKQQQQQNIFIDQNYASGRVTADYSLAPESSDIAQDINLGDVQDQRENNIEFEVPVGQVRPATYFTKVSDDQSSSGIASQFYSTLPNREAAEKLAALAAAGNVNSQLIGQLRKQQQQQQQQQQQSKGQQSDQSIPSNHKEEEPQQQGETSEQSPRPKQSERQRQIEHRQKLFYRSQKLREEQARRKEVKDEDEHQSEVSSEKEHTLRILVPEDGPEKEKTNAKDYDYENDGTEVSEEPESSSEGASFGSRIVSKKLR
ncbi:hypothetical protein QAD02_001935 [Eretmocerus hayati]|uniref:Uncharacterized protein n=1 Tax=Eretmocerus hayati TaxID=131215 RepID=A0ACC2NJ71_9HYME|nr:hypothetical protein QAD02_001935 [Eretmocerus hayati]